MDITSPSSGLVVGSIPAGSTKNNEHVLVFVIFCTSSGKSAPVAFTQWVRKFALANLAKAKRSTFCVIHINNHSYVYHNHTSLFICARQSFAFPNYFNMQIKRAYFYALLRFVVS